MLEVEKEGVYMNLGERIALARKQAGLSQEQLGEKLGVSRQAVSKWESNQTNPDVSYVAQMCRLLGVSSDWLLLGEESAQSAAPKHCPGCQAIVSGLDQFCPSCGQPLHNGTAKGYTVLLRAPQSNASSPAGDLVRLSASKLFPKDSPLHKPLSLGEAEALIRSAPLVLAKGLSKEQVYTVWDTAIYPSRFLFLQDTEETNPQILAEYPSIAPRNLITATPQEPMSFGMVVLAVMVGIVGAIILLMFL